MRNRFKPIQPGDQLPKSRLTVVSRSERSRPSWNCVCKCGGKTVVTDYALKVGNVRSCGCLRRESMARIGRREYALDR
jgi:hypothetical protein